MTSRRLLGILLTAQTVLCGWPSLAQQSAPLSVFEVKPLFDTKSRMPGILIPFRASGSLLSSGSSIFTASVSGTGGCKVMRDPFVTSILLMKCAEEGDPTLSIALALPDGSIQKFNYGPVEVRNPAAGYVVVKPPSGSTPPALSELAKRGGVLFVNCTTAIGCHTKSDVRVLKKSAAFLKSAILTKGMGAPFRPGAPQALSDDDYKALEAYLGAI